MKQEQTVEQIVKEYIATHNTKKLFFVAHAMGYVGRLTQPPVVAVNDAAAIQSAVDISSEIANLDDVAEALVELFGSDLPCLRAVAQAQVLSPDGFCKHNCGNCTPQQCWKAYLQYALGKRVK